jgi:hypothetical protein
LSRWAIEYFDGTQWVAFNVKKLGNISEELSGHEEAVFAITNTAANRALVLNDYPVRLLFDGNEIYSGVLKAVGYSMTELAVTVYNDVYEAMQRRVYSGSFTSTPANDVLASIMGVTTTDYFGYPTLGVGGPYEGDTPYGVAECVKAQMKNYSGAQVTAIKFYVKGVNGTTHVKCALYADSSGVPGALLGVTAEVAVGTSYSWVEFTFSSPINVTANANYWLAWISDDLIYMYVLEQEPPPYPYEHKYDLVVYSEGFKDPWTTPNPDGGHQPNIYAVLSVASFDGECPTTPVTVTWDNVIAFQAADDLRNLLNKDLWSEDGLLNIGTRDSCVLGLSFDEGIGNVVGDSSGYGNPGTVYPTPSNWTIGRMDTGDTDTACNANQKKASKFTSNAIGPLSKLTIRMKRSSSGKVRCALYADNAGSPGVLIAQTLESTVGTTTAWVDFAFDPDNMPVVTNGLVYWLAVLTAASYTVRSQSGAGPTIKYNNDTYSDGFADPFGSVSTTSNYEICIYMSGSTAKPEWVDGKYGKALSFDGATTFVEVEDSTILTPTEKITIATWVKISDFSDYPYLIEKCDDVGTQKGYALLIWNDGKPLLALKDGTNNHEIKSDNALTLNVWYYLVATYDGNKMRLYRNGILDKEGNVDAFTIEPTTNKLHFGSKYGAENWLSGIMDESCIYNRDLTSEEISFIYNQKPRGCFRKTDRSKKRQRIICKGVDLYGNEISGETGAGDDVAVITKLEPADEDALNAAATALLQELSSANKGTSISVPVTTGVYWKKGDLLPIHIPELAMDGLYRIQKTTKTATKVTFELEKSLSTLTTILNELKASSVEQVSARAGVRFTRSDSTAPPASPAAGDQWFQTDTFDYFYYNGSDWIQFQPVGA